MGKLTGINHAVALGKRKSLNGSCFRTNGSPVTLAHRSRSERVASLPGLFARPAGPKISALCRSRQNRRDLATLDPALAPDRTRIAYPSLRRKKKARYLRSHLCVIRAIRMTDNIVSLKPGGPILGSGASGDIDSPKACQVGHQQYSTAGGHVAAVEFHPSSSAVLRSTGRSRDRPMRKASGQQG